jgi:glycosyltransferase involved in cell wall biosynthesis
MNKNLLIINKTQFGYHTDYYKYCEYLRDEFDVTYLCFDSGFKKLEMNNVKVKYVFTKGIKPIRGARFIINALLAIASFKGIVFIHYFERCQILKQIFKKKKMILDIRTLSISPNDKKRMANDNQLIKATKYFNFITIISEGLRKKIKLDNKKSEVLPLGADIISTTNKNFNNGVHLLYVGTLNGRNIHQTIIGLSQYLNERNTNNEITYDIVGDGAELPYLKELVSKLSLEKIVKLHGRIPHFEIKPFFDKCNIGISYVPVTDFYEHQPVTKTFEYILSGIPCIATNTYENKQLITSENGYLCSDTPESFAEALNNTISNITNYNSDNIRSSLSEHTWHCIINKKLKPILKNI